MQIRFPVPCNHQKKCLGCFMTTFLPSFCYCLSVFPTTEYHLPIEVHESLSRIFSVFMRVSRDTEISLPHFRTHCHCVCNLLLMWGYIPLYLKYDHVFSQYKIIWKTVWNMVRWLLIKFLKLFNFNINKQGVQGAVMRKFL